MKLTHQETNDLLIVIEEWKACVAPTPGVSDAEYRDRVVRLTAELRNYMAGSAAYAMSLRAASPEEVA